MRRGRTAVTRSFSLSPEDSEFINKIATDSEFMFWNNKSEALAGAIELLRQWSKKPEKKRETFHRQFGRYER